MLLAEARWIGKALARVEPEKLSPLLNVGSGTAETREKIQPWIDREIFAPLRQRGVAIQHLDIQEGEGIDLHGDLYDDAFVARLGGSGYRSLLCCNVLEHVENPAAIAAKLERIIPVGGYLLFTVPNSYPYHPDPIDTMYRPSLEQFVQLFPHCNLVEGAVQNCGTGWDFVERNPLVMFAKVKRRLADRTEHGGTKGTASFLPWLFKSFKINCVLLRKERGT
ncbi:MAG TPA: hypothetical protein VLX60_05910 [Terriglobales bacterium]|nr:hypothetical protein [Terriglobales bacterium]